MDHGRLGEALVDERKILDYLLSSTHPVGVDKAAYFAKAGYTRTKWTRLRDDLLSIARHGEMVAEQESEFGTKLVVGGGRTGPLAIGSSN